MYTRNNDFIKRSKRNDVKFGLCFAPVSGSFPRKSSGYNNLLCCCETQPNLDLSDLHGLRADRNQKILPAIRLKPHHDERPCRFNRHFRRAYLHGRKRAPPPYILRITYARFTNKRHPAFSNFSLDTHPPFPRLENHKVDS